MADVRPTRPAAPRARPADPRARWSDGHDDPELRPGRGGFPRGAAARPPGTAQGRQRAPDADAPRPDRGHSPRVLRGRGRHRGDQHLHGERDRTGRLRHPGAGAGAESRGRPPRAPGGRRVHGARAAPATLRGGHPRSHQPHRVALARRQRPRLPRRVLRRAGRGLRRAGGGAARGRRGPADDRDRVRHLELQGGPVRRARGARAPRGGRAADGIGHHHRPERPHPLRPDDRGVLELRPSRAAVQHRAQLRARRPRVAPLRGGAVAHRRRAGQLPPQRRSAQRLRRLRPGPRGNGRGAAGIRRQRLPQHRRRVLRHDARAHSRHR